MAINIQAKKSLKEAKNFYRRKEFDAALILMTKAYTLGSIDAVKNIRTLIKLEKLKSLKLREGVKTTNFIFDFFELIRGQNFGKLRDIADVIFYGFSFDNKVFERYMNSYKYYKGSWKVNKDYYSLYSLGN